MFTENMEAEQIIDEEGMISIAKYHALA